jgi:hypothetical protein
MRNGLAVTGTVGRHKRDNVAGLQLCSVLCILDNNDIARIEVDVHILVVFRKAHGVCLNDIELNAKDASVISIHGSYRENGENHHKDRKGNQNPGYDL